MKHKKQPTAECMREQLRLAADEIIRLRESMEWLNEHAIVVWKRGYDPAGPWWHSIVRWFA